MKIKMFIVDLVMWKGWMILVVVETCDDYCCFFRFKKGDYFLGLGFRNFLIRFCMGRFYNLL